jgi:exosome complex RNA-binding protein Rrp4
MYSYKTNDEVFSKVIKAGKRTYLFDVKSTKGNELYLTLTERKKVIEDGKEYYQKHKLFLYKEDFQKFSDALEEVMQKVSDLNETGEYRVDIPSKNQIDPPFTFESL